MVIDRTLLHAPQWLILQGVRFCMHELLHQLPFEDLQRLKFQAGILKMPLFHLMVKQVWRIV